MSGTISILFARCSLIVGVGRFWTRHRRLKLSRTLAVCLWRTVLEKCMTFGWHAGLRNPSQLLLACFPNFFRKKVTTFKHDHKYSSLISESVLLTKATTR